MNNKGEELLTSNVVFIILNIVFFIMIIVFIYIQSSGSALVEQKTAKQIVLLIDASEKGTEIKLNVEEALNKAGKENIDINNAIRIDNQNNLVIIKLAEDSSYEYSFFNEVSVVYRIDGGYLFMSIT